MYFLLEINTFDFVSCNIKFILSSLLKARSCDTVILSHINLLVVGWMIKKISPSTRIILFAHGIEIWGKLGSRKRMMLQCCDSIIPVSQFTSDKIQKVHQIPASKCRVLNNCLDPFLPLGKEKSGRDIFRKKYGYTGNEQVLFTLTRLSSKERYKGYDRVLHALVKVKAQYPQIRYLIAGSYDPQEKAHLDELIARLGLDQHVIIAGFIDDAVLVDHFTMADIYVMPSMKEGFGIVFIEAMYYSLPVIGGNADGSVDALLNGRLGILVTPGNVNEIKEAIGKVLTDTAKYKPDNRLLQQHFSYESYKLKLNDMFKRSLGWGVGL